MHIGEGFDFLGWNFRMYSGKLLIKPSKKNVQAFYDKLRKSIGNHLTVKQEELIGLLNPMLRGWAQYHRHAVAKQTFARLESLLYWRLWAWAKRRHPNKSAQWIRRKYWRSAGNRNWVFAADVRSENGGKGTVELYSLSATPIQRHRKVQGVYHPYDPKWEMYGEQLRQTRMVSNMRYQKEWASYTRTNRAGADCAATRWTSILDGTIIISCIEPMAVPMPLAIASCFIQRVTREFIALVWKW